MKKEEWINHILESSEDIKPAEPNPFLYHKIMSKLEGAGYSKPISTSYITKWAFAASAMILLNISGLITYNKWVKQQHEEVALSALSKEMGIISTFNY